MNYLTGFTKFQNADSKGVFGSGWIYTQTITLSDGTCNLRMEGGPTTGVQKRGLIESVRIRNEGRHVFHLELQTGHLLLSGFHAVYIQKSFRKKGIRNTVHSILVVSRAHLIAVNTVKLIHVVKRKVTRRGDDDLVSGFLLKIVFCDQSLAE